MAPVVLDYDADGNVVGGHTVDELPARHYTGAPMQIQAQNSMSAQFADHPNALHSSPLLGSAYSTHGGPGPNRPSNNPAPQPQYVSMPFQPAPPQASYPQGLLRPPPTEPAAFRRQSQPSFEPVGYYQRPVQFQHFAQYGYPQRFHNHRMPQQGHSRETHPQAHFLNQPPQNYRPVGYQAFEGYGGSPQYQQRLQGDQQPPSGSRRHSYQHVSQRFDQRFANQQFQPVASSNCGPRALSPAPQFNIMGENHSEGQKNILPQAPPRPESYVVEDLTTTQTSSRPATPNLNGDHGSSQQPSEALRGDYSKPEPQVTRTEDIGESFDEGDAPQAEADSPVALDETVSAQDHNSTVSSSAPVHAKSVEDGLSFVNDFSAYFANDMNALATFEVLCKDYNREAINELEFVTGMQRLLHRANASHLMPAFMEFIPATWKEANRTWLKAAVADDYDKEQKPILSNIDVTAQTNKQPKPKKKRPVNAFSTADSPNALSRKTLLVKLPVCARDKPAALLTPPPSAIEPNLVLPPFIDPFQAGQPGNFQVHTKEDQGAIEGLAQSSKYESATKPKRKSLKSPKKRASVQRPAAAALPAVNSVGDFNSGYMRMRDINQKYASEVKHVGPVYPGRRALLARSSKPYIHGFCGKRFSHPGDVKRHHNKINCEGLDGRIKDAEVVWDEHPSCQADYPVLNYAKTMDGYVILDQESYDKVEAAIQAGLRDADQITDGKGSGITTALFDKVESDEEELSGEEEDTIDGMGEKKGTNASTKPASLKAPAPKARKRVASASTASTPPATKKASLDETAEDGDSTVRAVALGLRERK